MSEDVFFLAFSQYRAKQRGRARFSHALFSISLSLLPHSPNINSVLFFSSERSKQVNESRLKVLRAREEALASALSAAKAAAAARAAADAGKYKALLVDLALQAVHKLGEPEAVLVGRQCDAALLPEVAAAASERFEATFGKKAPKISASAAVAASDDDFLPPPPSEVGEGAPSW